MRIEQRAALPQSTRDEKAANTGRRSKPIAGLPECVRVVERAANQHTKLLYTAQSF